MPSGSKPGERRGGRKKGTPNKATLQKQALLEAAAEGLEGTTPIELWTKVLVDPANPLQLRLAVAKELAPYVHPRLSSTEAKVSVESHTDFWSDTANAAATTLLNGHARGTGEN